MLKTQTLPLSLSLSLAMAAAVAPLPATAQTAARPAAAKAPAKAATKPRTASKAAAVPAAAAAAAAAVILTQAQLDAAERVFVGKAECDHGDHVDLSAVEGKAGHFKLTHKSASYNVVPEETTTGAVRLEDKKSGVVWLQIPSKSMLMNAKIGQRVADNCLMAQQKS